MFDLSVQMEGESSSPLKPQELFSTIDKMTRIDFDLSRDLYKDLVGTLVTLVESPYKLLVRTPYNGRLFGHHRTSPVSK